MIKNKIIEMIATNYNIQNGDIQPSSTIEDLNFDSLDVIEIVMGIESEFKIAVEDDKIESIVTIQDFITIVETYKNAK